jgi:hypothetical protein
MNSHIRSAHPTELEAINKRREYFKALGEQRRAIQKELREQYGYYLPGTTS